MFIFRTLGEYLLRMFHGTNLGLSAGLTHFAFSGLNKFNIDHTARSISAVVKATTPQ